MRSLFVAMLLVLCPLMAEAQCYKCEKCGKYHCRPTTSDAGTPEASAQAVVQLVNAERSKRGLHLLSYDPHMGAQQHSQNQRARRSMYHARSGFAENVAVGQRSPEHVVRTWMNSSGHRANILGRRYTRIDVGRSGNYWTQRFR